MHVLRQPLNAVLNQQQAHVPSQLLNAVLNQRWWVKLLMLRLWIQRLCQRPRRHGEGCSHRSLLRKLLL
jgi:hypothetical protein